MARPSKRSLAMVALPVALLTFLLARQRVVVSVDYAALFAADVAGDPSQGGFERYWPVLSALGTRTLYSPKDCLPGRSGWEVWQASLDEFRLDLDSLEEGAFRPRLGVPFDREEYLRYFESVGLTAERSGTERERAPKEQEPVGQQRIPNLLLPTSIVSLLQARAREFAAAGDFEAMAHTLDALDSLAEQYHQQPRLTEVALGESVNTIAMEERSFLARHFGQHFSAEHWMAITMNHRAAVPPTDRAHVFRGQRWFALDLLQRLYTDDGHGDGRFVADLDPLLGGAPHWWQRARWRFQGFRQPSRKEARAQLERVFEGFADPSLAPTPAELRDFGVVAQMLGGFIPLDAGLPRIHAQRVALAVLHFAAVTGHEPRSLTELVPEYLDVSLLALEGTHFAFFPSNDGEPLLVAAMTGRAGIGPQRDDRAALASPDFCVLTAPLFLDGSSGD